jgi:hypothetical protein
LGSPFYVDPQDSAAIYDSDLANAQIGVNGSDLTPQGMRFTAIWLLVVWVAAKTISMDALAAPAVTPVMDVQPGAVTRTMDALAAPANIPDFSMPRTIQMDALGRTTSSSPRDSRTTTSMTAVNGIAFRVRHRSVRHTQTLEATADGRPAATGFGKSSSRSTRTTATSICKPGSASRGHRLRR